MSFLGTVSQLANTVRTVREVISGNFESFRGSEQSYPSSYGEGSVGMRLAFSEYSYDAARSPAGAGGSSGITLPLPQQLVDAAGIRVGEAELGTTGALVTDAFSGGINGDEIVRRIRESNIGDNISASELGQLLGNTSEAIRYFSRSAMDGVVPGAGLAVDTINGSTVNPHATLNFDGVNLKEYSFSWIFAPRTPEETQALSSIIRTINQNIHPEYGSAAGGGTASLNSALLRYPSLITARLIGVNEGNYPIFRYPMLAKNFSADYTPQGNALLKGGNPAFVNLSLTLQETKIRTRDDF